MRNQYLTTPETTGTVSKVIVPKFKCCITEITLESDKNKIMLFQLEMMMNEKKKLLSETTITSFF